MSTIFNGMDAYGLVFNSNLMHCLAAKVCTDFEEDTWDDYKYDYIDEVIEKLGLERCGSFSGSVFSIDSYGNETFECSDIYQDDTIYFMELNRYPALLKKAYDSIEQIEEECKHRIGAYLPDSFDYKGNLMHIVGGYWG